MRSVALPTQFERVWTQPFSRRRDVAALLHTAYGVVKAVSGAEFGGKGFLTVVARLTQALPRLKRPEFRLQTSRGVARNVAATKSPTASRQPVYVVAR